MNPILVLETTTRWRRAKSFFHLFLLVLAIAALIGVVVWSGSSELPLGQNKSWAQKNMGRYIMGNYALGSWFLLLVAVPALAAPAIAGERQKGTLPSLTLTHLSPLHILWGKLGASLLFPAIALLSLLPLVAVAFGYGGVSSADFGCAFLFQALTTFGCASLALNCSARHRHAHSALSTAYAILFVWIVATAFALLAAGNLGGLPRAVAQAVAFTNPLYGLFSVTFDDAPVTLQAQNIWQPCLFCLLVGAGSLRAARAAILRNFDVAENAGHLSGKATKRTPVKTAYRPHLRTVTPNAMFNADMGHHLGALRQKRGPLSVGAWLLLAFVAAMILSLALPDSSWRISLVIVIGIFMPALIFESMRTAVFSMWRDKSSGIWEQIRLTPMSGLEIVSGRVGALTARFALYFIPLNLLLMVLFNTQGVTATGTVNGGFSAFFRILADAILGICLGLVLGLRSPSPGAASAVAIGVMIFYWMLRSVFTGFDYTGRGPIAESMSLVIALALAGWLVRLVARRED